MRCLLSLVVALTAAACGDDDAPPDPDAGDGEAGVDAGADPEVAPPAPPAPPEPVVLTPCPAGWTATATDPVECLPWPEGTSSDCAGATALFPGTAACTAIGPPCAADGWPVGLPGEGVLYVRPDGDDDAAGTRDEPLASARIALERATSGDVVALSVGTWNEVVHVPEGVTLQGACVEGTRLEVDTEGPFPLVDVTRGGVVVRDLSLRGPRFGVWVHGRVASATLQSVLLEGTERFALAVWEGSTMQAQDVIVRGTLPDPILRDGGRGLDVEDGSTASLVRAAIEDSQDVGVFGGEDGSTIVLADSVVRRTQVEALSGTLGRGLEVELGASATLERVVLEQNHSSGAFAGDDATIELADVRVVDTLPTTSGIGPALAAVGGGLVTGTRVVARRSTESGLDASEQGRIVLDHVIVSDTGPRSTDGSFGRGLSAQTGGHVEVRHALVEGSHESGVFGGGDGTELVLTDTVVRGTHAQILDGLFGRGISIFDSASITAERVIVDDNRDVGVALIQTTSTLRDVAITRTASRELDGNVGRGLVLQDGADVTVERVLVRDCVEAGVTITGGGAILRGSDVDVEGVASSPFGTGRGLVLQGTAVAELARVRLARTHELGISVSEEGTTLTGEDFQVLDSLARDCLEGDELCESFGAGIAVGAYSDAAVALTRFRIERAALVGLQLARGGAIDLSVGLVTGCPIGANVQTEGFDAARLTDRVVYRDNGRNFDGETLPLP